MSQLLHDAHRREGKGAHLDVVPVTETTEFLLTSSVPDVEADCPKVGVESERVNLNTESG